MLKYHLFITGLAAVEYHPGKSCNGNKSAHFVPYRPSRKVWLKQLMTLKTGPVWMREGSYSLCC